MQSTLASLAVIILLAGMASAQSALQRAIRVWPGPRPDNVSLRALERRAFEMVNQERLRVGLNALAWNEAIVVFARRHSEDMARSSYFSHVSLDGRRVADRADERGISNWGSIGENIATLRGFSDPATHAITLWMNSAGHRRNLLRSGWDESGIGVSVSASGDFYFTQVFIRRR